MRVSFIIVLGSLIITRTALAQILVPLDIHLSFTGPTSDADAKVKPIAAYEFVSDSPNRPRAGHLTLEGYAAVTPGSPGTVRVRLPHPLAYRYAKVGEDSWLAVIGRVTTLDVAIPDANSSGFESLINRMPFAAYVKAMDHARLTEVAQIYARENPESIENFPQRDLVPDLVLRGRRGLIPLLPVPGGTLPDVLYPLAIGVDVVIDPKRNEVVTERSRLRPSPTLGRVVEVNADSVGLNGRIHLGGPTGYVTFGELTVLDLRDDDVGNFLLARAEIEQQHRAIMTTYKRLRGIPNSITRNRNGIPQSGHPDLENYATFNEADVCVSLLTGRRS